MSTQTLASPAPTQQTAPPWPIAARIFFRFCAVYFPIYCLSNQVINSVFPIPKIDVPDWAAIWPVRVPIIWVAQHIFRVKTELVYSGSGSGDKTFDWVLVFCILVVSLIATAVWSALDRKRESYPTLRKWFWLFLRICLGSQMFVYGFSKAVPLQMHFPYLSQQLEPFGQMSPMGVLWSSIGASPSYEIFAGCAEITGGLLLIFARTVTLGALVCLADMIQVFMLNMTYDVPVKLFSFHLIVMSLLLLTRDSPRLTNVFILNRPAEPSAHEPLFATRRANRIALAVLAFLWLWMLGNNVYGAWSSWYTYGGGAPKSALFGIWDVEQFSIDGQVRPPLLTDNARFRHVIFDFPGKASFTRMDESRAGFDAAIDTKAKTLVLTKPSDKSYKASLAFDRPAPDQLVFDGRMDGHNIHMQMHLKDRKDFPLFATRGFHWISEYPFHR
jgi:uncharacterized membrane protein YphA (DoxX/SURF4 family)